MKKYLLIVLLILICTSVAFADEYVLIMSKDDNVCQYMHKLYNEDLKKYGEVRYDRHKEFNAIEWEDKNYYKISYGKKEYLDRMALISRFDINGDGKEETVVKWAGSYKGISSDHFYYFKNEDASLFKEDAFDVAILFNKAARSIGSGARYAYELKELPQFLYIGISDKEAKTYYSLGKYLYIHPFYFNGTYYLNIKDEVPSDIKRIYSGKFQVISKFTKDNQPKDVCYFIKTTECRKERKGNK
jgi:hypothetical protein